MHSVFPAEQTKIKTNSGNLPHSYVTPLFFSVFIQAHGKRRSTFLAFRAPAFLLGFPDNKTLFLFRYLRFYIFLIAIHR